MKSGAIVSKPKKLLKATENSSSSEYYSVSDDNVKESPKNIVEKSKVLKQVKQISTQSNQPQKTPVKPVEKKEESEYS